uniref:Large subunit ribosomal protein L10 n=1 Tax=Tetraselmis sp. GSL018 TaxID=582737 RepID=A0A061SDW1_9CHLO
MAPVTSSNLLSSRANVASGSSLYPHRGCTRSFSAARPLRIECAISRQKKEEIVKKIQGKLDDSMLVFGMRFSKMTVKQMEGLRRELPEESSMIVAKNTLMRVATESDGYTQWKDIDQCTSQDNVWVFSPEEHVADTVKKLSKLTKALSKEYKASGLGPSGEITGGVMDGRFLTENEIYKLESMPTKKDLYQKAAVGIKAVPTRIGKGVKAVPTKLAIAVKQLSDEDNPDRQLLVGDVFPKKDA